ncbi:leucine-rich PPR motif-containing protein, mitochondrial [Apis mellifera caucasica]|nr:leucine-rich PPR motif-containing protein, mitochondrial [Apis mellifera caucasica]KAG9430013.1 leucine-rich PPR motif-containing protein, mitochondrial [Apis mellifera carnica]
MISIIDLIDSSNVIDTNKLLSLLYWCNNVTCLPVDRIKLAESLWIILTVCNFKVSVVHYNTLLKLYIENEHNFSIINLLKDMKCKQIYPNEKTYEIYIKYYCMKGNINKALMLLHDMKKLKFSISKSIFDLLMLGYSQSGDIKNVNNILNIMKQYKLNVNNQTYAIIMYTYAKLNNIVKIKEIIKDCNLNKIYFSNKNILKIIYILAENNHIEDIDVIHKYLRKKKIISNNEIKIILKIININYINVAIKTLLKMGLNNEHPQFESILRLILKHIINTKMLIKDIILFCNFTGNKEISKKYFLISLYYSLKKNDNLSFLLLKICEKYCLLRPHYFWPLLVRQANKYSVQGILNILEIMINDFNILPCIDTITDYVLPFIYGEVDYIRKLLMKYKINENIINNSYVLFFLKKRKIAEAARYIRYFKDEYFYKIIASDLRYSAIFKNDVINFLYISCNVVENINSNSTFILTNKSSYTIFVSMDKQLHEFMIDFPSQKIWMTKIIKHSINYDINLKYETVKTICEYLGEYARNDVMSILQNLIK